MQKRVLVINKVDGINVPILNIRKGPHGEYAYFQYENISMSMTKALERYDIKNLTTEQISKIEAEHKALHDKMQAEFYEQKMKERFNCVESCLVCAPLLIELNPNAEQSGIPAIAKIDGEMAKNYKGIGKGMAYIKEGVVIAFHYGFEQPTNAPKVQTRRVQFSSHEICF